MTRNDPTMSRTNRRRHERFTLRPMYTSVVAEWLHPPGSAGAARREAAGHAYDISEAGVRMELDERLDVGTIVQVRLRLPGNPHPIRTSGRIAWTFDEDDDPAGGPCRMGVELTRFKTPHDRTALLSCLGSGALPRAA